MAKGYPILDSWCILLVKDLCKSGFQGMGSDLREGSDLNEISPTLFIRAMEFPPWAQQLTQLLATM